ncbi:unnamed protein product, partial [Mesorhabditis belari]|uniref:SH2 domain-containing protein n=1 Tax=Mesorhabditis belari TaxID=2138241 RepID=A0AAF3F4C8_9BILA
MRKPRKHCKGTEPALWRNQLKEKVVVAKCRVMEKKLRQRRPEELPYYHNGETSSFSRLLSAAGVGSFLLRSASYPGSYALLVNTGKVIQKFLIETTDHGRYRLAPRTFGSIDEIIERYTARPIADNVCLIRAALSTNSIDGSWPSSTNTSYLSNDTARNTDYDSGYCVAAPSIDPNANPMNNSSNFGTSHIIASVQALRKSREEKQWKTCFVSLMEDLNGNTSELCISDNEQTHRPRMSFSMDSCHMYSIHRSVFGRDGCIFIGQNDESTFLCFRPAHTYLAWFSLLRPRVLWLKAAVYNIGRCIEASRVSEIALLHVTIDKFVSDSMLRCDSLYSASLMLDGVRVFCSRAFTPCASTRSQQPLTIVFDSSYMTSCAPTAAPCSVQVMLCTVANSQNGFGVLKRALPRATTAMSRQFLMQGDEDVEDKPENGFWVRIRRITVKVLAASQYMPLLSLIRQDGYQLYEWVWNRLPTAQRSQFVTSLWIMYLSRTRELTRPPCGSLEELVISVLQRTIASSASTPLRSDSFCTALLGAGLRIAAGAQLEAQLDTPPLSTIIAKKNIQPGDVDMLVEALVRIASETAAFRILALVASVARDQHPEDPFLTMRILASFFVLRFANPILLQSEGGQNTNQIAKMIQTSANKACSPKLDEENCSVASSQFRKLFESLFMADADCLVGVETEWSCDSCALVSHLIASVLPTEQENTDTDDPCPVPLSPNILRILRPPSHHHHV